MSDGPIVTIICCYNNAPVYHGLVRSLEGQTCRHRLIGIDNGGNRGFASCAAAYNSTLRGVETPYVVYAHQDILLEAPDALERFVGCLRRLKEDDILGVAGVRFGEPSVYANMMHASNVTGGLVRAGDRRFSGMIPCDTVDECFFGGYAAHFRSRPFDEELCDGWHLYAVDRCLDTKARAGGRVYICDIPLVHLSSGQTASGDYPADLYRDFYRLCRRYAGDFPAIRTTCIYARTDLPGRVDLFFRRSPGYRALRSSIGRILRRTGLRR